MFSAADIAWFFVEKGQGDASVTQLKLQKLVYYAQGFYLAMYGEPLFAEAIEAWDYGPVVPELRQHHRHKGADTILPSEPPFGQAPQDMQIIEFLNSIWQRFGRYTAGQLVDLTHREQPWLSAYYGSKVISRDSMQTYFETRLPELEPSELGQGFNDLGDLVDSLGSGDFEKRIPKEVIERAKSLSAKLKNSRGKKKFPPDLAEKLASYTD